MNFIKKLFSKKEQVEPELPPIKSPLDILTYAICDAGIWTWYNPELPHHLQLEFNHTLLLFPAKTQGGSPSHKLTLQFDDIVCIWVMSDEYNTLDEEHLKRFNQDSAGPFSVDYEHFSFQAHEIRRIVAAAENAESIFGTDEVEILENSDYKKIGFMASGIGLVVVAKSMRLITFGGEVQLDEIPEIHKAWWAYWADYWEKRETSVRLPNDYLCEITIPFDR